MERQAEATSIKKNIGALQVFRHTVQIMMFFLLPGIYMLAFGELKGLYISVAGGSFVFPDTLYGFADILAILIFTIFFGRYFCGWICAFGTYGDFLYELSSRLLKLRFGLSPKADRLLKYLKYVVLVFIVIFLWTAGSEAFSGASPWDAFASVFDLPGAFGALAVGFVLLLLISIGSLFIERFFCRYLCPMGALLSVVSRLSIVKIRMSKDGCRSCMACTRACSMGMQLSKTDEVRGGECISCMKCVEKCPRGNAGAGIFGRRPAALRICSVALAIGAVLYVGGRYGFTALKETGGIPDNQVLDVGGNGMYEDGTYTGSGTGYRGSTTTVSVTVENGYITSIETISTGDDMEFYLRAEDGVFSGILGTQSADVDTVTGATYSSEGIIEAVEDALAQAGGDFSTDEKTGEITEDEEKAEGEGKGRGKNLHGEAGI